MDKSEKHRYLSNLRDPIVKSAIQSLQFPPGSHGLDVGCGIGTHTLILAKSVLPTGHVTGLDLSPHQLTYARQAAKESEVSNNVSFRKGDMNDLPFDEDSFDWVWSMDLVGYAPVEPLPLILELVRVVKPGGRIAILAWSSEELLPGYPLLEARLSGTTAGIAPFAKGKSPEKHFSCALGWFREAGLEALSAQTFVGTTHAPLTDTVRAELLSLFQMRWPGVQSELEPDDWAEFQRLCLPESPNFILDHPDYYAFFTYSMFQGKVAT
jgi:demethylmenaquinone methyltransferase/2-methoxy-6-polyprenyl-1,4-benzoquinol methylase